MRLEFVDVTSSTHSKTIRKDDRGAWKVVHHGFKDKSKNPIVIGSIYWSDFHGEYIFMTETSAVYTAKDLLDIQDHIYGLVDVLNAAERRVQREQKLVSMGTGTGKREM